MRILFTGGGTMGPVSPLLAVWTKLKKEDSKHEFLWIGTKTGPEKKVIKNLGISYKVVSNGKLRRYFSVQNFFDIFKIIFGFIQSVFVILKFKPTIVLSAGGFNSVPVVWAAGILGKEVVIHQQDIQVGLANKLMAPFATKISVTFEKSLQDFPKKKTVKIGNPYRELILQGKKERGFEFFKLKKDFPVLLVMGGGTGAARINNFIFNNLEEITKFCQVIHVLGNREERIEKRTNYKAYNFLEEELADAYAVADLVISRAGLSASTELSVLGKPTVFIPITNNHQEKNADYFFKKQAVLVWEEKSLTIDKVKELKELLNKKEKLQFLANKISQIMPKDSTERFVELIKDVGL